MEEHPDEVPTNEAVALLLAQNVGTITISEGTLPLGHDEVAGSLSGARSWL